MRSKKINLTITGCLGRMGQQLIKSAVKDRRFKIQSLTENKTNSRYSPVTHQKEILFNLIQKKPIIPSETRRDLFPLGTPLGLRDRNGSRRMPFCQGMSVGQVRAAWVRDQCMGLTDLSALPCH